MYGKVGLEVVTTAMGDCQRIPIGINIICSLEKAHRGSNNNYLHVILFIGVLIDVPEPDAGQ